MAAGRTAFEAALAATTSSGPVPALAIPIAWRGCAS